MIGTSACSQKGRFAEAGVFGLLCLSIGSLYPVTKVALRGFDPFTLVLYRLVIGSLVLLGWARWRGFELPRGSHTLGWLALAGITNVSCAFLLVTWGQQHVTASFAAILGGTGPIFTALGAALLLSDERLTLRRTVGLAVGFVGVVVLVHRDLGWSGSTARSQQALAVAAILAGAAGLALVAILVRRRCEGLSPIQVALPMALSGLTFLVCFTIALHLVGAAPLRSNFADPAAVSATLLLGLINSGIGPLLYYGLILSWGATRTALLGYAVPVVGVGLSLLLLGERLTLETGIGLVLVTSSFIWVRPIERRASGVPAALVDGPVGASTPSTSGGIDA